VPLTNARSTLSDAIDDLKSSWGQGTNNAEGLAWAWRVLSPDQPFNEGSAYGTLNTKKIIVLMTDGQNELTPQPPTGANLNPNRSDYSSVGYAFKNRLGSTSPSAIGLVVDSKVATVCANAKQKDIVIYTVLFDASGGSLSQGVEAMFRKCATDATKFYRANSRSALIAAFDNVAADVSKLRLTK
jgi:hypothetical protein